MRKIAKWRREKMEKMRSFDLGFQKKSKQIGNHAQPYIKGVSSNAETIIKKWIISECLSKIEKYRISVKKKKNI